jgi:hypothetical protein
VEADASDYAIGAVLSQLHNDVWHPIAYLSKTLTAPQRNYEVYDKELLAIMESLDTWIGFATGIPRVRFSYTVPEPVEPVPVSGIHRYRTLNGAVSYETHGITYTRGFVVLPCPPFNLAKVSRTSIDVRRAVLEVIRGGGRIQNKWVGDLPWQ